MKKINCLFIVIIIILSIKISFAQDNGTVTSTEKINFEEIKAEVLAQNSIFNFDKLFRRYEANDTTLDVEDYKHLYYGYTFTHRYSPNRRTTENEKKVNKILAKQSPTYSDYKSILKISENVFKQNPFDLDIIWVAHLASSNLKSRSNAKKYLYKFDKIVETIFLSGDGISMQSAFTVIDIRHEYIILEIAGFEFNNEQSRVSKHYDYLKIKKNEHGIKGLYFNVESISKAN